MRGRRRGPRRLRERVKAALGAGGDDAGSAGPLRGGVRRQLQGRRARREIGICGFPTRRLAILGRLVISLLLRPERHGGVHVLSFNLSRGKPDARAHPQNGHHRNKSIAYLQRCHSGDGMLEKSKIPALGHVSRYTQSWLPEAFGIRPWRLKHKGPGRFSRVRMKAQPCSPEQEASAVSATVTKELRLTLNLPDLAQRHCQQFDVEQVVSCLASAEQRQPFRLVRVRGDGHPALQAASLCGPCMLPLVPGRSDARAEKSPFEARAHKQHRSRSMLMD